MNKDKHVLPDTRDAFSRRIKREANKNNQGMFNKTIYGPDNEPLVTVNMEVSKELIENGKQK